MRNPIWKFGSDLTNRMLIWSILSILSGLYIWFAANEFGRGFDIQAFVGLIDGLAIVGARTAARRKSTADPMREALFIRKVLWINFGLDVLYILGGAWVLLNYTNVFWRGTGWGIVLQGTFLFFFDLFHAIKIPVELK
ncbi:hypothetical protein [Candidatus Villigracilis affinis]|uniref:DUF6992 family protein n=1 Tax=Candidatus Villigracilis affinis TaxID=3140682 RepID=UPI001DCE6A28|nr:hypothetical protein [Anaerolineales bacterium]